MAVARIAQVERKPREIGCAALNTPQRRAKPKTVSILMNTHASLAPKNPGEMERRDVNRRGDVIERQIFCEPCGQQQSGRFNLFTMRLRRRRSAVPCPNAACAVSVSDYAVKERQRSVLNRQVVSLAREQKLAQPLLQQKNSMAAQRVPKLERLLPFGVFPEQANGFHQDFRAESEHRTIVATIDGMRHAVGFLAAKKQT